MRIIFLLLLISFAALQGNAQLLAKSGGDDLVLKENSFDFGRIRQGKPVTHNFEIFNRGKSPLMIEDVEASCGCTTPEWSQEPVKPNNSSLIKVGFNASTEGKFEKTITIRYNDGKVKTLTISGEVYPAPTTSAPLNTSLSLLKQ